MAKRVGGVMFLAVDGQRWDAKGNFTYNLGRPKREAVVGSASVHGYKEMAQTPFCEGEITDVGSIPLDQLLGVTDATVTIELANGKVFVLRDAWYAAEGTANTEEGNVEVRFEGLSADEST